MTAFLLMSYTFFLNIGCDGYWDTHENPTEATSGVIQSPGYPNGIAHRIYCSWHILGPADRRIKVEFDDLDMPEPYAYVRNGTTYYWCRSRVSASYK